MQKDICYKCIKLYRFIRLVLGEDMSDRAIARKLGMDWRGFYNMKTGLRKVPRVEILERIAGELGVNKHFVLEIVSSGISPEQIYKMVHGGKVGRELKCLVRDYPPEARTTDFEDKHLIDRVSSGRSQEKSKTLNAIIAKLYGTLDEQEVYKIISQEMIPHQLRMRVYTIDDAGENAYLKVYSLGKLFPVEIMKRLKLDENKLGIPVDKIKEYHRVIRKGETVFIPNLVEILQNIVRVKKMGLAFKAVHKFLHFDQSVFAPLQIDGEVFGAFALESPLLTREDIPVVKAFADQIAQVLYKARLYRERGEQVRKYQSLLYSVGEPIFLINADSKQIEEANQEARRLSGFELSELITKNIFELFTPADNKAMSKGMNGLKKSGRFQMENINLLTSRGEKVLVSLKASMVNFGTGNLILQVLHQHCN